MKVTELIERLQEALREANMADAEVQVQPCWEMGLCSPGIADIDVVYFNGKELVLIGFDAYKIRTDKCTLDLLARYNREDECDTPGQHAERG